MPNPAFQRSPLPEQRFHTTRWSMIRAAAGGEGAISGDSRAALETLCRTYWYPLYAHIRRRHRDAEEARDLTQEFFSRLIEKEFLKSADPRRGRFRTFLLTAVDRFLANEHDRARAQKRGGNRTAFSFDMHDAEQKLAREPAEALTPETAFEKRWGVTLLETVFAELRHEYTGPEKRDLFEALQAYLPRGSGPTSYAELAGRLRMSEAAVKVAIHRLRKRFGALLRREIQQTVAAPDEVDDEIRRLFAALSR